MSKKNSPWTSMALLALLAVAPLAGSGAVGTTAPDFTLTAADGSEHTLADSAGKTVVLEWINPNCPYSLRHTREQTMINLAAQYGDVVWLAVNSTASDHGDYLQPSEHLSFNQENGIEYPVLYDPSGDVGHAYNAKTTPHMYVIDAGRTILYNGAIDDDPRGQLSTEERDNYVDSALTTLASEGSVDPATTRPYGCSVKYGV